MTQDQKNQIFNIYNTFVKFEVFPSISDVELDKFILFNNEHLLAYFDKSTNKFNADIIAFFQEILPKNRPRILILAYWWFDIGEDYSYFYNKSLGLPGYITTSTPNDYENNQINIECAGVTMSIKYSGLQTNKKFRVSYGINAINHLAIKLNAPRRFVEIVDRGDDFAIYAAVFLQDITAFKNNIKNLFSSISLSNSQTIVEKQVLEEL